MTGYDGSLPPDDGRWWYWNTARHAWALSVDGEPDGDPHADCIQPHTGADGEHYDCDGRPL